MLIGASGCAFAGAGGGEATPMSTSEKYTREWLRPNPGLRASTPSASIRFPLRVDVLNAIIVLIGVRWPKCYS